MSSWPRQLVGYRQDLASTAVGCRLVHPPVDLAVDGHRALSTESVVDLDGYDEDMLAIPRGELLELSVTRICFRSGPAHSLLISHGDSLGALALIMSVTLWPCRQASFQEPLACTVLWRRA